MRIEIGVILALLCKNAISKESKEPPPFFLQDAADGMCLAGSTFKRCGIDTLWYVVGSPGSYQIHKRPYEEDEEELCLAKKSCDSYKEIEDLQLTKCTHCGSAKWNILGDASTGYIMTENDGKTCLTRPKGSKDAKTAPCDSPKEDGVNFINMNLQFASKDDLKLMQSPAARFIAAAGEGELENVKKLMEEVDSVDVRDWDKLTALIPAASGGHLDVVKYLLEKGADVNASDKDGITALMEAAVMGHTHVLEYLIEHGAEVDETSSSGVTALWLASGEGRTEVVEYLLNKGVDVNTARGDGVSAFMNACMNSHPKTVQMLLQHGADVLTTDQEGLNVLAATAEKGTLEIIQMLIDEVKSKHGEDALNEFVNHASKTGFTPLIVATAHSRVPIAEYLVKEHKVDLDYAQPETGVTALMYAAAGGSLEILKLLVDHGANVNHLHSNDASALFEAATAGKVEVTKYLLEIDSNIELIDKDGVTTLMSAASVGHSEICFIFACMLKSYVVSNILQLLLLLIYLITIFNPTSITSTVLHFLSKIPIATCNR